MPVRDGVTLGGKERDRSARITPSDIADAKRRASLDASPVGRRMLNATLDNSTADGPIPDTES